MKKQNDEPALNPTMENVSVSYFQSPSELHPTKLKWIVPEIHPLSKREVAQNTAREGIPEEEPWTNRILAEGVSFLNQKKRSDPTRWKDVFIGNNI